MQHKNPHINYLYFGLAFVFLIISILISLWPKESSLGAYLFFFPYAFGQALLEISLLIFVTYIAKVYLGKVAHSLCILFTFAILIAHLIDSILVRMFNLSIWELLDICIFEESLENFIHLLEATGISLLVWGLIFSSIFLFFCLGLLVYKFSDKLSKRKLLPFNIPFFLQVFICIPTALMLWDFSARHITGPESHRRFVKILPWKHTLTQPKESLFALNAPLKRPSSESEIFELLEKETSFLEKKPNIYLFVLESLREDAITEDIAPNFNRFKNSYVHFESALSNGNASHISWFSIFHSQLPFYWKHVQQNCSEGSAPLHLLKKWGYQLRLYSSADLAYYGMDKVIFGNDLKLLTERKHFRHGDLSAAQTDLLTLNALRQDLSENLTLEQGQVFIIFLDGTHFDYTWGADWSPKFTPISEETTYFKMFHSNEDIQNIKNKYHSAVNYMDHLFGLFFETLPKKEEAIVVITGDHGEEFFEHGHLCHASHLSKQQTNVPLYFKFGDQKRPIVARMVASQIDIFPSIIDYLSERTYPFLQGNSLFRPATNPFAVTARFNAGLTPYEFSIHSGKKKMIAQFSDQKDIFASKELKILAIETVDDETSEMKVGQLTEFGTAIERLFNP